jgi:DNA-binding IclR family transcriptional regulator
LFERETTIWNAMESTADDATPPVPDEVRLVGSDRVLAVLRELATRPAGATLDELSRALASPKATVHRALASLRRAGFATQDGPGRYQLGDEFLRLAFTHHEARPDQVRVHPALAALAVRFGETAHYAVLDDDHVIYRAKVDPPAGGVRLTSVVGGRNLAHATGVGKLLLALSLPDDDAVRAWATGRELETRTPSTITTVDRLVAELATIRRDGFAVDDEENEPGIVCLAVPAYLTSATTPSGAVSVSAVRFRTPLSTLRDAAEEIRAIVADGGTP